MTIAVGTPVEDQESIVTGTHGFSISPTGANRYLLLGVGFQISGGVNSITGVTALVGASPTAMTQIAQLDDGEASTRTALFGLIAPDTGTNDIVITMNTSGIHEYCATAVALTDIHQTTPKGTGYTKTETEISGIRPTVDVLNVNSGELVFNCFVGRRGTTITVDGSQTLLSEMTQGFTHFGMSHKSATGTVAMKWASTNDIGSASIGVALKPTAVAAGNPWYYYAQQN